MGMEEHTYKLKVSVAVPEGGVRVSQLSNDARNLEAACDSALVMLCTKPQDGTLRVAVLGMSDEGAPMPNSEVWATWLLLGSLLAEDTQLLPYQRAVAEGVRASAKLYSELVNASQAEVSGPDPRGLVDIFKGESDDASN